MRFILSENSDDLMIKLMKRFNQFLLEEGMYMVKCPRCGNEVSKSSNEWDYSVFRAKRFDCEVCEKSFKAYYHKDGGLSHTIPKAK